MLGPEAAMVAARLAELRGTRGLEGAGAKELRPIYAEAAGSARVYAAPRREGGTLWAGLWERVRGALGPEGPAGEASGPGAMLAAVPALAPVRPAPPRETPVPAEGPLACLPAPRRAPP
jgi:hypothetical protein